MILVQEYIDAEGNSPFRIWFSSLDARVAAKITARLERIAFGNFSNVKGARKGVFEDRINYGPGYRIYLGKDGDQIVILLGGGTKKHQGRDIEKAVKLWAEYKLRKRKEAE